MKAFFISWSSEGEPFHVERDGPALWIYWWHIVICISRVSVADIIEKLLSELKGKDTYEKQHEADEAKVRDLGDMVDHLNDEIQRGRDELERFREKARDGREHRREKIANLKEEIADLKAKLHDAEVERDDAEYERDEESELKELVQERLGIVLEYTQLGGG